MRCEGLLTFLAFCLTACCSASPQEKIVDAVTREHIEEIRQKYGACVFGIGGSILQQVNLLAIDFKIAGSFNLEEARELIVTAVDGYLKKINGNQELRDTLIIDPLTAANLEYSFTVTDADEESLAFFALSGGRVIYAIAGAPYRIIHTETFERSHAELNCFKSDAF